MNDLATTTKTAAMSNMTATPPIVTEVFWSNRDIGLVCLLDDVPRSFASDDDVVGGFVVNNVGTFVGALVGTKVGLGVGIRDGMGVGDHDGRVVGTAEGKLVGMDDGTAVGDKV
jgi:hypothetical protein